MAINLKKGQTIDLSKDTYNLSKVTLGLGWDVRQKKKGFLGGLLGSNEPDFDLDAIAFMLDENGKVANLGQVANHRGRQVVLVNSDVIFFNNLRHPEGVAFHTGDNLTGDGDGDDEQIVVMLNQMPARYHRIIFMACIYQGTARSQHFGLVDNAYIRAVDANGKEMARFNLSNDPEYNLMRTVVFGEVYRRGDGWKFRALGNAHPSDSFGDILKDYVYQNT